MRFSTFFTRSSLLLALSLAAPATAGEIVVSFKFTERCKVMATGVPLSTAKVFEEWDNKRITTKQLLEKVPEINRQIIDTCDPSTKS